MMGARLRRRKIVAAVVTLLVLAAIFAGLTVASRQGVPQPAPAPTPQQRMAFAEVLKSLAAEYGENQPRGAVIAPTTRKAWFETRFAQRTELPVEQDASVYVLRARGEFTVYTGPDNDTPPLKGTVLTAVVEDPTGEAKPVLLNVQVMSAPQPLDGLGSVQPLGLSAG